MYSFYFIAYRTKLLFSLILPTYIKLFHIIQPNHPQISIFLISCPAIYSNRPSRWRYPYLSILCRSMSYNRGKLIMFFHSSDKTLVMSIPHIEPAFIPYSLRCQICLCMCYLVFSPLKIKIDIIRLFFYPSCQIKQIDSCHPLFHDR